jgi:hypothetical protein
LGCRHGSSGRAPALQAGSPEFGMRGGRIKENDGGDKVNYDIL